MDAVNTPSSSSSVIVQCSDQYDLFDKVLPYLETRSPLGNLHWKSPTRPLRSIDKLDVCFVREAKTNDQPNAVRRHQIPGLRPTPYVKLFLLRCDDKDVYKDTAKKEIKHWLRLQEIVPDSKSPKKGQERHDAFEYIILHVVLPGTAAANQPRSLKHISVEATESTDSVNSKSKWPGKGSSTIYDKLRADFSSSKAPFERVAQIRISDDNVGPPSALGSSNYEEQSLDFVDKLKTAILQSFDARVSQYEDDIRDRDSQRALPGWNFCTFFVLKEGLAKGFENVGLLEDALAVYKELDAGLDSVVREQFGQADVDPAGALLSFSQDLKPAIRDALESLKIQSGSSDAFVLIPDLDSVIEREKQCFPLDAERIDYQQRILTNQVSALDLRIYIYMRKLRIMFRKAKIAAVVSKQQTAETHSPYDVSIISDICAQASEFINFTARALRRDFYAAWGGQQGLNNNELETQDLVIGNLVASWKFSVILQILHECQVTKILHERLTGGLEHQETLSAIDSKEDSAATSGSSRPFSSGQVSVNITGDSRPKYNSSFRASYIRNEKRNGDESNNYANLALWVAELLVMLRAVIQSANPDALRCCLTGGVRKSSELDIRGEGSNHETSGIKSVTLLAVHASKATCTRVFRLITIFAFQCYRLANQTQASRRMLVSLAKLDFEVGNLNHAAIWLEKIPGIADIQPRTLTDLEMLRMYAKSVDKDRLPDQRMKCLISILKSFSDGSTSTIITEPQIELQATFNELFTASTQVNDTNLPFSLLFEVAQIKPHVRHLKDRDGFSIPVLIALRQPIQLEANLKLSLHLSAAHAQEPSRLELQISPHQVALGMSWTEFLFDSNISLSQTYQMVQLRLSIGKLHFLYDFDGLMGLEGTRHQRMSKACSKLVIFPRAESLKIDACPAYVTDLARPRQVSVTINSGRQDAYDVAIRVRPATAGVRLSLHEATPDDNEGVSSKSALEIVSQEGMTVINISQVLRDSAVVLNVPYAVENDTIQVLDLKFEVTYHTAQGSFKAYFSKSIDHSLPLSVNVQDVFQSNGIFSRFTAGPSRQTPVRILKWQFKSILAGELLTSQVSIDNVTAFAKMPAVCMVHIQKTDDDDGLTAQPRLVLQVKYQCMEDIVLSSIVQTFMMEAEAKGIRSGGSLLSSHLIAQVPRLWTMHQLEAWALTQEVELWSFEAMQWDDALYALHEEERTEAEAWLRSWHTRHMRIDLSASRTKTRTLKLLVDVPTPGLVLSSRLLLDRNRGWKVFPQGQAISAHLEITCDGDVDESAQIVYEIKVQAETWLIGGTRKGSIPITKGKHTLQLLLIPQKTGHLLLPSIEMRCRRGNPNKEYAAIPCEIENKSQAQSVLVTSGLHSTTVATGLVGTGGAGSDYLLAAVRHRM